jgi:hypothetical protein
MAALRRRHDFRARPIRADRAVGTAATHAVQVSEAGAVGPRRRSAQCSNAAHAGRQIMLSRHIALVSETSTTDFAELAAVAAALQKQVTRDFGPIWGVEANVAAYSKLEHLPLDYWPLIVKDDLPPSRGCRLSQ